MAEKVVERSADITPKKALASLRASFPGYRIASFDVIAGGAGYRAVLSEFPPGKGEGAGEGDDAPDSDENPAVDPDAGDSDGDSDADSDGPPAPPKAKKDKGGEAGGLKAVEHKLDAIMQALGIGGPAGPTDPGAGPDGPPPPGADPMAGGDMPQPAPPPLPPPAKPHGGPAGAGGMNMPFSKVAAERRSFVIWREPDADGSLPTVKQAVAEITAQLPTTHKVAKITKKAAKIEGGKPTYVYVAAVTTK